MRILLFIFAFLPLIANSQTVTQPGLREYQISGAALPDSILYILGTDTLDGSAKQGLGKFHRADSLFARFGDHDFYGLGTERPAVFGEDSIETANDSMYILLRGMSGSLHQKIEFLKNGTMRFDQEEGSPNKTQIILMPLQQTEGNDPAYLATSSNPNSTAARNNDQTVWGFNTTGVQGTVDDGDVAFALAIENNYELLGEFYNEFHLFHNDSSGQVRRPITFFLNRKFNWDWEGAFEVPNFYLRPGNTINEDPYMGFEFDSANHIVYHYYRDPFYSNYGVRHIMDADNSHYTIENNGTASWFFNTTGFLGSVLSGYLKHTTFAGNPTALTAYGDADYLGKVTLGWGLDFVGSVLTVDSSQVATQYDLTTISGSGDDWGSDVVNTDITLTGDGTIGNVLKVDTSVIATPYDLTQIPISSLKAATAINSIDNTTFKQEWKWDALAGTDGLKLSSISTVAASDAQKLLNVSLSGTNGTSGQDTYAGYFSNIHAGTTSTNYGVYGIATNGTSANYGVYGVANGSNGNGVVGTSSANIGVLGIGAIGVYASATSAVGVDANATSGIAIQGTATTGTGLEAIVTSGIPISVQDNSAGTNTVEPMIQMYHLTTGTAAAGIGSSIVYNTEANDGSDYVSTTLTSKWTTATAGSRVSNFVVSGVNAAVEADILTMKGSGQMQLNKYVSGAFTGTAVNDLFIDASGNVIVGSMTGQSWTVDADDATTPILVSNQTLAFRGNRGINTDLIDGAVDSVSLVLDFSELVTVTTIDSDDNFAIWDAGSGMEEKITYANLITDIIADIPGGSDTHFGGDDLTWDANRVHDQSTYTTEIGGTNMTWKFQDNNATTGAQIILAGNVGNSDAPMGQILFMYDDSGFATDQTAWTMVATRETDSQEHSTLEITANEAASAPPVATWEENENLSDNTQETSLRLNSGIAYTQYWESTGANAITLDRGYYNVALLTGHTGTITLPQIYGIDESNIEIDAAQVPIGQEYVISNFSGSAVTIACFGDTGSANDDHLNGVENGTFSLSNNESVIVKAVAIISSEGRWFTYD